MLFLIFRTHCTTGYNLSNHFFFFPLLDIFLLHVSQRYLLPLYSHNQGILDVWCVFPFYPLFHLTVLNLFISLGCLFGLFPAICLPIFSFSLQLCLAIIEAVSWVFYFCYIYFISKCPSSFFFKSNFFCSILFFYGDFYSF